VAFTYRPRAFIAGATVTGFAALALVLLLVARGRRLAEHEEHDPLAVPHVDT
jgi:multisubunit Na+/H+ antiporter MnhC subunit